jgi:hypothetical protein
MCVEDFFRKFERIDTLSLSWSIFITDSEVLYLPTEMPRLRTSHLYWCPKLVDVGWMFFSNMSVAHLNGKKLFLVQPVAYLMFCCCAEFCGFRTPGLTATPASAVFTQETPALDMTGWRTACDDTTSAAPPNVVSIPEHILLKEAS